MIEIIFVNGESRTIYLPEEEARRFVAWFADPISNAGTIAARTTFRTKQWDATNANSVREFAVRWDSLASVSVR